MEHIFWLEHYPRSISGLIEYLSQKDKVYCICYNDDIFENRSTMGWTNDSFKNVEFIFLNKIDSVEVFLKKFCSDHKTAINFIMGVRASNISQITKKYILSGRNKRVFMIAERPYFYGKGIISSLLLKLLYKWLGFKYRNKITGVFAMGKMGVESYKSWSKGNVFPFLYPRFNEIESSNIKDSSFPIKALYVGQLDYRKGVDILVDVFKNLPNSIQLDVVGTNGDIQDLIKRKITDIPNVNYKGVWCSGDVVSKTSTYDFSIVPSRYDGWGMYVMEALEAGVGVITTDQTGSKDLVFASGAGVVVKSESKESLSNAIEEIIASPNVLLLWKKNARAYKSRISKDVVGKYVRDIVGSMSVEEMNKIKAPWL